MLEGASYKRLGEHDDVVFLENNGVFDDEYFRKLYDHVMNEIIRKNARLIKVYVLEDAITKKELDDVMKLKLRWHGSHVRKYSCYEKIFKNKKVIKEIPLIFYDSDYNREKYRKEVVTGISIPSLSVQYDSIYSRYLIDFNKDNDNLESTNIIMKDYFLDLDENDGLYDFMGAPEIVTMNDIRKYVRTFCDRNNYFNLINMLFGFLDKCKYKSCSKIPAYVPNHLKEYYQSFHNFDKIEDKVENEEVINDKIVIKSGVQIQNLQLVFEIEQLLNKYKNLDVLKYFEKLNNIKEKLNIESKSSLEDDNLSLVIKSQTQTELTTELIQLYTEIKWDIDYQKKNIIQVDVIDKYFLQMLENSYQVIEEDKIDKRISELITFINYFEKGKDNIEFDKCYEMQNRIFMILKNIMVYNKDVRTKILEDLPESYQIGISLLLKKDFDKIMEYDDVKDTDLYYSICSMLIGEYSNMEYIEKSLDIMDYIDKDILLEKNDKKVLVKKMEH